MRRNSNKQNMPLFDFHISTNADLDSKYKLMQRQVINLIHNKLSIKNIVNPHCLNKILNWTVRWRQKQQNSYLIPNNKIRKIFLRHS